jgi:hypothetical protein
MWEEVRARFVIVNYCAFISSMIVIPKGSLWSTTIIIAECLLAYEENFSVLDLDVIPCL